ncbi:hypothetical protein ACTXT7_009914 [Hymenolepis weldensis]
MSDVTGPIPVGAHPEAGSNIFGATERSTQASSKVHWTTTYCISKLAAAAAFFYVYPSAATAYLSGLSDQLYRCDYLPLYQ